MLVALFAVGTATGAGVVIRSPLPRRPAPPEMIGRDASLDFFVSIASEVQREIGGYGLPRSSAN
jgi:DHA3 family tetracycline resistance protein-like MFS transporter